jgi:hypothetical protein
MSGDSTFKFTEVKMHTPQDNLMAALGIIQTHLLASDSNLKREVMFGPVFDFTERVSLEAAVALLVPLLETVDDKRWEE